MIKQTEKHIKRIVTFIFFSISFLFLMTIPVQAYIDPSVMTYAIQAIAGIAIALGTVFGVYWRKIKKAFSSESSNKKSVIEPDSLLFDEDSDFVVETPPQKTKPQKKHNLKTRYADIILPAIFFSITFLVYPACTLFLSNISQFGLFFYKFLNPITIAFVAIVILICIIPLIFNNFSNYLASVVIFILAVGMYLQGSLLNPDLPVFNGLNIDWAAYSKESMISVIVWIVLAVCILLFALIFKKQYRPISRILCVVLSITQLLTITYLFFTTRSNDEVPQNYFSTKDQFVLSKTDNTVIIILDTCDMVHFESVIRDSSALGDKLKDFTFFNNAIAGAAPTYLGVPYMFTGVEYDITMSPKEYHEFAYSNSHLFEDIKKEDGKIKFFSGEYDLVEEVDSSYFENVSNAIKPYEIISRKALLNSLVKFSLYYLTPTPVKKYFMIYSDPISPYLFVPEISTEPCSFNDPKFYTDLNSNTITTDNLGKVLSVYHLNGSHGPITMDENSKYSTTATHVQQILGSFNIVYSFLDYMKKAGIYDSSTIIITADHGGTAYFQNPTILVKKPFEEKEELTTLSSPVTFYNLYNTIAKSVLDSPGNEYGEDLFEVPEDETRTRKHYVINPYVTRVLFPEDEVFQNSLVTEITFYGKANDIDNISYSIDTSYIEDEN